MKIQRILSEIFQTQLCLWCELPNQTQNMMCEACKKVLPFCQQTLSAPNLDEVIALFDYQPPISQLITRYKFNGHLLLTRFFADNFIEKIQSPLPDLIIPVPLHPFRLKERGFNQALEIAKPVGRYFGIPVDARACIKIKHTEPQSSLTRAVRIKNLKNVFASTKTIHAQHVAIVDDVFTTGSTVSQIAALLRTAGVPKISAWCCARTV